MEWQSVWILFLAYFLGSFPTGVVLSRRRFGIDVREMGSGNIGATNITRNFGWKAGATTFLFDFAKGYFAVNMARNFFPHDPWVATHAGCAVVLGHCFSAFLRFRGGKGVATTMGAWMGVVPGAAWVLMASYALLLITVRVSAWGSLVGITASSLYAALVIDSVPGRSLVYLCAGLVLVCHQSNLRRLWRSL